VIDEPGYLSPCRQISNLLYRLAVPSVHYLNQIRPAYRLPTQKALRRIPQAWRLLTGSSISRWFGLTGDRYRGNQPINPINASDIKISY
jgi:hypothetical protein